jgi:hypothetical protein
MEMTIYLRCISTSKKLGESSYAEVYQSMYNGKNVALKIIPFHENIHASTGDPYMTSIADLYQEIAITMLLCKDVQHGQIPRHFIKAEK